MAAGWNLSHGDIKKYYVSEDELWAAFICQIVKWSHAGKCWHIWPTVGSYDTGKRP